MTVEVGDPRLPDRFWAKVQVAPSGCWEWTANKNRGYGNFTVVGKTRKAHRHSYETLVGPIPDGLTVDHTCHDPQRCAGGPTCRHRSCVNPAHLEPVTQAENVRRGVSAGLPMDAVPIVRERILAGDPLKSIANDYGVGINVIFSVAEDVRWRDDPDAPRQPLRAQRNCLGCGEPITEGRRNRVYCSKGCIRRAAYKRSPRAHAAAARRLAKSRDSDLTKET